MLMKMLLSNQLLGRRVYKLITMETVANPLYLKKTIPFNHIKLKAHTSFSNTTTAQTWPYSYVRLKKSVQNVLKTN